MDLVKTVQYSPKDWPPWLLSKLTAALSRALQDDVLGLSGPDAANSFVCEPFGVGNKLNKKRVVIHALVSIGQLLSSLSRLYVTVVQEASCTVAGFTVAALQDIIKEQGLLRNMADAGDALAALMTKHHDLLDWELDRTKTNKAATDLQDNLAIGVLGVASGVVNLWLRVREIFSEPSTSLQVGPHLTCLQAVLRLSSLMLRAWPGPGLALGWQDRTTAAAAAADASSCSRSSAHSYQYTALPLSVSCAAQLSLVLYVEVFSRCCGQQCSTVLKQGLPRPVLEVLASADTQHVLLVGLATAAYTSRAEQARTKGHNQAASSARSAAGSRKDGSTPRPAHAAGDECWHVQLADALGLQGALPLLAFAMGRPKEILRTDCTALGLIMCMAARKKLRSSAAGCRDLPSHLHQPLFLTLVELMLLDPRPLFLHTICPLLEEVVLSAPSACCAPRCRSPCCPSCQRCHRRPKN